MHLILCIDARDGLSFCGRRLSRDSLLVAHMLMLTQGHTLWVHPYSAKLFPQGTVMSDDTVSNQSGTGGLLFCGNYPC